jgi:ABC-type nitrate/sulfonate/bicarbonate transport system substrate-binding protein
LILELRPLPETMSCRSSAVARARAALPRAAVVLLACALAGLAPATRAADALRIAVAQTPLSLPVYVAQQRGFFADEQLAVTLEDCVGGDRCLRRLLDGQADLATASEMPVVLQSFRHPDAVILATMATSSDNLKLVARRASGVTRAEQLAGRRVGLAIGTSAHYLLESHLLAVGVDPRGVTLVPLHGEETVTALSAGRVDAVAVSEPYGYALLHGVDATGVRLPVRGGHIEHYNVVAPRSALGLRDAVLARALRAIDRAEQLIQSRPDQAKAILGERLRLAPAVVDWAWDGLSFRLALEQALLSAMEGEARWAQREGHVPAGARPNMLTLIYPGPLASFKPAAVGTGN